MIKLIGDEMKKQQDHIKWLLDTFVSKDKLCVVVASDADGLHRAQFYKIDDIDKIIEDIYKRINQLTEQVNDLTKQVKVLTKAIDPLSIALLQTEIGRALYAQICKTKLNGQENIYQYAKQIQDIIGDHHNAEENEQIKNALQKILEEVFDDISLINSAEKRLRLLLDYEERYLQLLNTHKEEILFAQSVQKELREERSQFFRQVLQSVVDTFQRTGVKQEIASKWIEAFVESYVNSLDLSGDLAKTSFVNIMTELRDELRLLVDAMNASE